MLTLIALPEIGWTLKRTGKNRGLSCTQPYTATEGHGHHCMRGRTGGWGCRDEKESLSPGRNACRDRGGVGLVVAWCGECVSVLYAGFIYGDGYAVGFAVDVEGCG